MSIETILKEVFTRVFPVANDASAMVLGDENWDSLKQIELVTEIEHEFGVEIEVREISELNSFSAAAKLVSRKLESH